MITSKYSNISYPIFALSKKPYEVKFTLNKILIRKDKYSHLETVDDKSLPGDYFARLLQLDTRVVFDYTCKSIQELLLCRAKWGVDVNAIPHDLYRNESHKATIRKVERVRGNLIWLRNISYPFIIPTSEKVILQDSLYAIITNINNEWVIREFTYEPVFKRKFVQL